MKLHREKERNRGIEGERKGGREEERGRTGSGKSDDGLGR